MQSKRELPQDKLPQEISNKLPAHLSFQEIPVYMSTHKKAYISGINHLFDTIHIGNQLEASEAQKKAASQAWIILSKRLLSQLSFLVSAIMNGKTGKGSLLHLLEEDGLVARLDAAGKQQAPADSIARIKALQIGISIALYKPVTEKDLQFLNKLANIPTYRALALLGLLPLLSGLQIYGLINTNLVKGLSDRERQLLLPALTPFVTPFNRENFMQEAITHYCVAESTRKANIDFLLILMKQSPQFSETFIRKIMDNGTHADWDIRERDFALHTVFGERPDLITDSVLRSLFEKMCNREGCRILLIEIMAKLWEKRPDLLRDPQFRKRVRQELFSYLPDQDLGVASAAGRALVQLSEILDKDAIREHLFIILAVRIGEGGERAQRMSLRVLALFYEKHPHEAILPKICAKYNHGSPMVKQEAQRALMTLLKLNPSLLSEVRATFRLFDISSWPQDDEARAGAMTVLIKTIVAETDPFAQTTVGILQTTFIQRALLSALSHDSEIIVSTAIDGLSRLFELQPNIINAQMVTKIHNSPPTISISLAEKYWTLLGLMYGNRPDLLTEDFFQRLLEELPNFLPSLCLSNFFSKSPVSVTPLRLQNIVNKYANTFIYIKIVYMQELILTIFEKRPGLLDNNQIFLNFLSNALDKHAPTVRPKIPFGIVTPDLLNRLASFIEKNPQVLPPETATGIIQKFVDTPDVGPEKLAFVMKVFMRNNPTDIVTMPLGEPFFDEVNCIPRRFDSLLRALQHTTNRLIAKGSPDSRDYDPKYRDVKKPAEDLVSALKQAQKTFFIHPCFSNPSAEALRKFKKVCNKAITDAEDEFINHRSIWDEIHPILKKILGILALIPLGIPALLVEKYSTNGYVETFFKKPKPRAYQELQVFKTGVNCLFERCP